MLFFISLLILLNDLTSLTNAETNEHEIGVKPLEPVKQHSSDSADLFNKKIPRNSTSVAKSNAQGEPPAQAFNFMARVNDEDNIHFRDSFEKYPENTHGVKLSNKELIEHILHLILKNKYGSVNEKSIYGNRQAKELNRHHHSNIGYYSDEDWVPYSPEEHKPDLYAMKLPVKAIETPHGGILGKLQFHFAPLHNPLEPYI